MKPRRRRARTSTGEGYLAGRRSRIVPHDFVLDALVSVSPEIRPMFGCIAVYLGERIVLILREREPPTDNGVWLATSREHHASLREEFPRMRSISVLGGSETNWQLIAADDPDFEEAALRAVRLVIEGDPRIGRIPKRRTPRIRRR